MGDLGKLLRHYDDGGSNDVRTTTKGLRTLSMESINPDSYINEDTRAPITHALNRNKIHIAEIQETHAPYGSRYNRNGFRPITTEAEIEAKEKTK